MPGIYVHREVRNHHGNENKIERDTEMRTLHGTMMHIEREREGERQREVSF